MSESNPTRRDVLRGVVRSLVLIPAALVPGATLASCGGRVECTDTKGLAPAEAKARVDQNYLDTSPDPAKLCNLCEQFEPAAKENACGGCKVIKGPIHPKGSCNLFVKKA